MLGGAGWANAVEELLVEPAVVVFAVGPVLCLVLEVIRENQLTVGHLALLPGGFVVVALRLITKYIGID